MFYPYSSGYHIPSSPSLPGAWSSAWSLPQQHLEHQTPIQAAQINRVDDNHESSSSEYLDLDCPESTDTPSPSIRKLSKADPPGALFASAQHEISYLSLSQSSLASCQDDPIADFNTSSEKYSPSYPHKSTPHTLERNVSLDTLSLFSASVSNSPMTSSSSTSSQKFFEVGDINLDTTHSRNSLRKPSEPPPPNFDNNALGIRDTFMDQTRHIARVSNSDRDYSPERYPYPLLLSQPDGNNTWTLSLDPAISHLISGSSVESESSCASYHDDQAIAKPRDTFPSASSTPRRNGSFLSLPPSQVGIDIAKFRAASDVSMIVSSTSSVQQRHYNPNTRHVDLYANNLPHDFPLSTVQDSGLDPQQSSRSKKLIKKSKNVFGRLKKLFMPKETIPEDTQAHTFIAANPPGSSRRFLPSYRRYKLTKSTQSSTPSFGHDFRPEDTIHAHKNVDEKYTYEYHARPKTLKEIKSQRRFSLPMALGRTSSHFTPSMKRNITTSVPRSHSSMYIASQNENLDFAA